LRLMKASMFWVMGRLMAYMSIDIIGDPECAA
jgi:hypothetical protein